MRMPSKEPGPSYCFLANKSVHCVPIDQINVYSDTLLDKIGERQFIPKIDRELHGEKDYTHINGYATSTDDMDQSAGFLSPFQKNLLYSLNNPSLSDVDADSTNADSDGTKSKIADSSVVRKKVESNRYSDENISTIIDNYSTHAVFWPSFTIDLAKDMENHYDQSKLFLTKLFPHWTDPSKIIIKQLTGGITNMLLKCKYVPTEEVKLMRVYGYGTNLIIDRDREFISHLILHALNLAPPIHAKFNNGLVYGFLPGKSLMPNELANEDIFPFIAQQLGNWHSTIDTKLVESGVEEMRNFKSTKYKKKKFISNIWELVEEWITIVPITEDLISTFNENLETEVNQSNIRDILKKEFSWLHESLKNGSSPEVSCHCDLLSGNIIIPDDIRNHLLHGSSPPPNTRNPVKFIDYEYILPAPRAFDIANHFAEWQGFDCNRSAIPTPSKDNPILRKWVRAYLNNEEDPELIDNVISEIQDYFGFPGFYWGIWATIQSEISNIDFNYSKYAKLRLQEYWDWKKFFLGKGTQRPSI